YYYPDMRKDEVLLLKQWDSEGSLSGGTRAPFTLHSAFDDPSSPADAEDRESME
ncbi:aclN, partial [Symbiodinium sp. KB8]